VQPGGILVKQVSEVGGGLMSRADLEDHEAL